MYICVQNTTLLSVIVFCVKTYIFVSVRVLLMCCCCDNRTLAPHPNRIAGVQLGSGQRAGLAPRAHPRSPNALSSDPALVQNLGMFYHFQVTVRDIITFVNRCVRLWKMSFCHKLTKNTLFFLSSHHSSSVISSVPLSCSIPLLLILHCIFYRSHSRRDSNRRHSRSRSQSYSHRRRSRSRSYSAEYQRRRSQSTSPMSSRRHHTESRVSLLRFEDRTKQATGVVTVLTHIL